MSSEPIAGHSLPIWFERRVVTSAQRLPPSPTPPPPQNAPKSVFADLHDELPGAGGRARGRDGPPRPRPPLHRLRPLPVPLPPAALARRRPPLLFGARRRPPAGLALSGQGRGEEGQEDGGGGFLQIISVGVPTYAGMKTGFYADFGP